MVLMNRTGEKFLPVRHLPALDTKDGMYYFLVDSRMGLKMIKSDAWGNTNEVFGTRVMNIR